MNAGVVDYALYKDGKEYLGTAKVSLPDINNKVLSVAGAGMGGDIDVPIPRIDAMEVTIDWIDATKAAYQLAEHKRHIIDLRVVHEGIDPVSGQVETKNFKHILEICPKSLSGGEVAPASAQAISGTYSCYSRKDYIGKDLMLHVDPLRYIYMGPDGKNIFASLKKGLGK